MSYVLMVVRYAGILTAGLNERARAQSHFLLGEVREVHPMRILYISSRFFFLLEHFKGTKAMIRGHQGLMTF